MLKNDIIFEIASQIETTLFIEKNLVHIEDVFLKMQREIRSSKKYTENNKSTYDKKIEEILRRINYMRISSIHTFHMLEELLIMLSNEVDEK